MKNQEVQLRQVVQLSQRQIDYVWKMLAIKIKKEAQIIEEFKHVFQALVTNGHENYYAKIPKCETMYSVQIAHEKKKL